MKPAEECEAKFLVEGAEALASATGILKNLGARLGPARRTRLRDLYLDTEDHRLLRAGIGLRVRIAGRRAIVTAKTRRSEPGRLTRRIEWEEEHDAQRIRIPGPLPRGPIATWLRRSMGVTTLQPLVEFDHDRTQHNARLPGNLTVKLCLDHVRRAGSGTPFEFHEVELEHAAGDARGLKRFARQVKNATGWTSDGTSKLERALHALKIRPPAPPKASAFRLRANHRLSEAAWAVLRRRFAEFRWNEPGARAGLDPEFLHDMRVAARRMRAALRIFRGALPTEFVNHAGGELRFFFTDMGRVRDLDVCAALLRSRIPESDGAGVTAWIEFFEQRRERAWTRLLRDFGSPRYARFLNFMESALAAAPPGPADAPSAEIRIGEAAPKILRRSFRKALESAFALDADAPETAFHDVRIRFKKLRYAIEFFTDLQPGAMRKLCRELAELQDVLGEFQDEVVLRSLLRRNGDRGVSEDLQTARVRLEEQIAERIAERQRTFLRLRKRLRAKTARALIEKLGRGKRM